MSEPASEDLFLSEELAPVAKKAAKKTAKKSAKKTAKKAAKKTAKKAAKKTAKKAAKKAAKKSAKKAAKKVATKTSETAAEKATAVAETMPSPEAAPVQEQDAPTPHADPAPATDEQPKIGRVKGGGRVKRDSSDDKAPALEQTESSDTPDPSDDGDRPPRGKKRGRRNRRGRDRDEDYVPRPVVLEGPPVEVSGMLELAPKGFGFLRVPEKDFEQDRKDVFVTPDFVRKFGLRQGVWIKGISMTGRKGPQLSEITSVNDEEVEIAKKHPHFDELKAVNPSRRIAFETTQERATTRILDIVAPIGRGQRGLIVSPPRSGKTTLLLHVAEALQEKYDEQIHLIILLVDERPEEVTEFKRSMPDAEIYASSNDQGAKNHARMAELCIERAKRLVEAGKDVFILMDSITRLARAYNNVSGGGKKGKGRGYQSGGIVAGALEMPRRIFAAARDTRTAGSLTILATALVQTNSKADELIFQEFKGTGNMELVLDRRIAEQYLYPAVDIFKSGTRREELLFAPHQLHKIHMIRRGLSGHKPAEALERMLFFVKKFPNNAQMLLEIKG